MLWRNVTQECHGECECLEAYLGNLSEMGAFESSLERFAKRVVGYPFPRRRALQEKGETNAKVPRREPDWNVLQTVRGRCGWNRGREGEVEGAEGQ